MEFIEFKGIIALGDCRVGSIVDAEKETPDVPNIPECNSLRDADEDQTE